jgi:non-homologous end joining protein Ku
LFSDLLIEIEEFVKESQIPTLHFEKPYYLEQARAKRLR